MQEVHWNETWDHFFSISTICVLFFSFPNPSFPYLYLYSCCMYVYVTYFTKLPNGNSAYSAFIVFVNLVDFVSSICRAALSESVRAQWKWWGRGSGWKGDIDTCSCGSRQSSAFPLVKGMLSAQLMMIIIMISSKWFKTSDSRRCVLKSWRIPASVPAHNP